MKPKLIALFLLVGLIPLTIIGWWASSSAKSALMKTSYGQLEGMRDVKKAQIEKFFDERNGDIQVLSETVSTLRKTAFDKLEAVREIKRSAIERYFHNIEGQIVTFSEDPAIVSAMKSLKERFRTIRTENQITPERLKQMRAELQTYYTMDFLSEFKAQNDGEIVDVAPIFNRLDDDSIAAQYYYIQDNKNPLGSKHRLDRADDDSSYSQFHKSIHPVVRNFLKEFGYYDIFLVDSETGDVVYSVFKELDFSTSLIDGPYADTNFGEAFRDANQSTSKDAVVLVDYKRYTPSYEAAASFIASPIYDGDKKIGVAVFQMPIDRLNAIMSERDGLGDTGETYLVGPDRLMRSDSYIDPENHSVNASFREPEKGKVETEAALNALSGKTGSKVIKDYNGNPVLSAFSPVKVGDLTWALLAEIDIAEAFCPKDEKGQYFFKKYVDLYGYYDLFLINPDGYVFYTVAREADFQSNMLTGKYKDSGLGNLTKTVLESHKFGFADFNPYAPSNGEPAAFIALPVEENGRVEVVVVLQLSLDAINSIMMQRDGMGETGETYLIGPNKLMRSDSYLDPTYHTVFASFANPQKGKVDTEGANEALSGQTASKVITDYNGNPVLSAYTPLNVFGTTWALLAEIDLAEVNQPINALVRTTLAIALLIAALVALLAAFISSRIATPLKRMTAMIRDIAEGEGDLTKVLPVTGKDEIGEVAKWFNVFVEKLNDLIAEIAQSSEQVASSSEELAASSQNLSSAATEQAASLEETSASIEELNGSIDRNSANAQSANEIAQKSSQDTEKGGAAVLKTVDAMRRITEQIKIIDDIADQTNLLALNAAIEAARAGEMGKGFAVVAVEVRKLAERSQHAAKEITELSHDSVNNADEAGKMIQQIVPDIQKTAQLIQDITVSCEEQESGANQIRQAIGALDQVTQQNSATAEESAAASEQLSAQAQSLQELVSRFKIHNRNFDSIHPRQLERKKGSLKIPHTSLENQTIPALEDRSEWVNE